MFSLIQLLLLGIVTQNSFSAAIDPERIPKLIRSDVENLLNQAQTKDKKYQAQVVVIREKIERFESNFLEKGITPKDTRELSTLFQMLAFLRAIDLDSGAPLSCEPLVRTLKAQMGDYSKPGEYEPAFSIVREMLETFCVPGENKTN